MQTPWKRLPEQVSVLSVICSPARTERTLGVTSLGSGAQSGRWTSPEAQYVFETDGEQVLWRKDAKVFEKRVKSAWNCWKGSELDQFCLVRLVRGAGIHVSVCVVACVDCENQFTCELNFLRRSHSLSVCVLRIWGFTNGLRSNANWSDSSLLLFDSWRSFLTTWVRPVLKHGPRGLTCVQVFGC